MHLCICWPYLQITSRISLECSTWHIWPVNVYLSYSLLKSRFRFSSDLNALKLKKKNHIIEMNLCVSIHVYLYLCIYRQIKPTPHLHLCLAHQIGYVRSLAWCPHRCYDLESHGSSSDYPDKSECLPRLGLLAVAGSSGTVEIYRLVFEVWLFLHFIFCIIHLS